MSSWKKNIKNNLFDRLKKDGYGFDHVRYVKSRKFKIALLLEKGLLGSTQSPRLKNNKHLILEIHYEKILLYETLAYVGFGDEKILLKQIDNWQDRINYVKFTIETIYDEYFYEIDELERMFSYRSDFKDLKKLLNIVYPELKVRCCDSRSEELIWWLGSGIFSFRVCKTPDYKKLTVDSYFYGSGSPKYQNGVTYTLAEKYRNIIKQNKSTQYIFDFDLTRFKNIYLKCRKVK